MTDKQKIRELEDRLAKAEWLAEGRALIIESCTKRIQELEQNQCQCPPRLPPLQFPSSTYSNLPYETRKD